MSTPPPPPPPGGDQNNGPVINAVVWIFTSIALLCVCARLYGRLRLTRNIGWDDFWIVVSMLLSLTYSSLASTYVHLGGGRHPYYIGLPATIQAVRIITIGNIPGIVSVAVPKLAVACLLIRLLNPSKTQKTILYTLSISCIITQTLCAVFLWVRCTPKAGLWNPSLPGTKCWAITPIVNYFIFAGSYSAFVDLYLALWPMTVLYKLQLNIRKKIGLSCVLGLGIIAAAVGIYKCTTLPELQEGSDYTFATTKIEIMTSVEATVIIIAACLPTLRPIFLLLTHRAPTSHPTPAHKATPHDYPLHSLSASSNSNPKSKDSKSKRSKDPYGVESGLDGLGETDSMEDRMLPLAVSTPSEGGIVRTLDVDVESNVEKGGGGEGGWGEGRREEWGETRVWGGGGKFDRRRS